MCPLMTFSDLFNLTPDLDWQTTNDESVQLNQVRTLSSELVLLRMEALCSSAMLRCLNSKNSATRECRPRLAIASTAVAAAYARVSIIRDIAFASLSCALCRGV